MLVILRVHIRVDVTSCPFPLPAWEYKLWASTISETEIGYRRKAYTIFWVFARISTAICHYYPYFYVFFITTGSTRICQPRIQATKRAFSGAIDSRSGGGLTACATIEKGKWARWP